MRVLFTGEECWMVNMANLIIKYGWLHLGGGNLVRRTPPGMPILVTGQWVRDTLKGERRTCYIM